MAVLIFFFVHWYFSLFFQTFFHHRYAAHSMFSMNRFWERVFYFLSFIAQGSSYLSPYAYAILHRMHHAHADTELDPHSPKYDKNLFSMMWRTKEIYNDIFSGNLKVEDKYKKGLPHWFSLDKLADKWFIRIAWVAVYVAFYWFFSPHWAFYLLLPLHFVMGPLHGAIINWFAHKYGYKNYTTEDTSHNLMPVDFLMLGEGFHNNHHKYQRNPNFGKRWYEFDPIYPIIIAFNKLGIIQLNRAKSD